MPLSDQNIKQIKSIAELIEKTSGDYGEIHLIYKRPCWRHIKIVQGETMEKKDCEEKDKNKTE